jgi:UDP-N-acetylglucosamine 1-carboxyvinyltransferase
MEKLIIEGGYRLGGEISISGAKNATLPIMVASLLGSGTHTINNVPSLKDIFTMGSILNVLGAGFELEGARVQIRTEKIKSVEAPYEFVRTMRASVLVLGPLLARTGKAKVSLPGGCAIGERPINLHIMGLKKMGADIDLKEGYIEARAKRLKGASVYLDIPTVTGTENLMMAAVLAEGTTVIENAACEPEVVDLANALISMGADIEGAGTGIIRVRGVNSLTPLDYSIIPDRIETATYMVAAGITGSTVRIRGGNNGHVKSIIMKLMESGVIVTPDGDEMVVEGPERPRSIDIKTMPYPGFPTDMQAQIMALMTVADGTSFITESIFENRFMHVAEMKRLGADISVKGSTATVRGRKGLKGAPVMATDLRASVSLVLAGLAARGKTVVDRLYHLDRGYERIEEKLSRIGARIRRVR